jgi:hypothetical protein
MTAGLGLRNAVDPGLALMLGVAAVTGVDRLPAAYGMGEEKGR